MAEVTVLDYGAGNVRSLKNALERLGWSVREVECADDIDAASVLVFPGVGAFGAAMANLEAMGVVSALKRYLEDPTRPFLGICIGMQVLFEGSSESPGASGLGAMKGTVSRFESSAAFPVPHVGWNGAVGPTELVDDSRYYFVHSFRVEDCEWGVAKTTYGDDSFVSAVERGAQCAVQFHPEKSGAAGLALLDRFLRRGPRAVARNKPAWAPRATRLARRVVCALDVRENDDGDLVVTKGDGYDVRNQDDRRVRNLGKPVDLAARYYDEGGDEIAILNICAFKGEPVSDLPLLEVLRQASRRVFVPLTIGGGIRAYDDGIRTVGALEVAAAYFRAGADKVSIGSDAVYAALDLLNNGDRRQESSIEQIARVYGNQAVVVSIDPKRVWVDDDVDNVGKHVVVRPDGRRCWYQCTVSGGRKAVDLDARDLAVAAERLGAGELMLNCIDCDGKKNGFDLPLLSMIKAAVTIPVIASSGAGTPDHFVNAFKHTDVDAALAAGIFHRREVEIRDVKTALQNAGLPVRITPATLLDASS
ncbi:hypothetical protein CTAYLR_006568 [Chrysophaeum taylorii]|uniref:Glutamine amidotransferase domain-containing protein n=1 Tax=Chrysophaeum taylorii TaxID=2483200 RepID=A0AAD7XJK3_9STRA|nr:hypothetical protein CTAYLR_006568 [Chrysophaeum taylorii]